MNFEPQLSLRLAKRVAMAGALRTLLAVGVTAIVVAIVVAGALLLTGLTDTRDQRLNVISQGAPYSVAIEPTPAGIKRAIKGLPAGLVAETSIGTQQMPVRSANAIGVAVFEEQRWTKDGSVMPAAASSYRVLEGEFPSESGSIALSAPLAAQLGVSVGDTVQLAYDPGSAARVVGLVVSRSSHSANIILGAPGTRWSLHPSDLVQPWLANAVNIAVSGDTADSSNVEQELANIGLLTVTAGIAEPRPFFASQPLLLGIPTLLLVGASVGGVLLSRIRRIRSDFSVLLAIGISAGVVRRVIHWSNAAIVGTGVVIGAALGWVASVALLPAMVSWTDQDVELRGLGVGTVVALMVATVLASVIVTWITLRSMRLDEMTGAGLRSSTESVAIRQSATRQSDTRQSGTRHRSRKVPVRRLIQVVAAAALVVMMQSAGLDFAGSALLSIAATVLAIATIPDLLGLLGSVGARTSPGIRYATRVSQREFVRGMVAAGTVIVALVSPLTMAATSASIDSFNSSVHLWRPLPDQLSVAVQQPLSDAARMAIADSAGAPIIPLYGGQAALPNFQRDGNILVVDTADDFESAVGYHFTEQERTGLAAGQLVTFDPAVAGQTEINLRPYDASRKPIAVRALTAAGERSVPPGDPSGAVMLRNVANDLGLQPKIDSYRILGGADRRPQVEQTAIENGLLPTQIRVDPGVPPTETSSSRFAALVGLALAFLLSVGFALVEMREWRPNLQQLSDLGVRRGSLLGAGAVLTAAPALVGTILGMLLGMVTATVRISVSNIPLVTPWGQYLAASGGLVVALGLTGVVMAAVAVPAESSGRFAHSA